MFPESDVHLINISIIIIVLVIIMVFFRVPLRSFVIRREYALIFSPGVGDALAITRS